MPSIADLTILVPVDVSESHLPSVDVLDLLGAIEVVLLGYFPVPTQAEPALIKDEYEADAEARLLALADGRPNTTEVLVFTHDRKATIDRIADQYDCDAVLTVGDATAVERIFVPLRGDVNIERIVSVAAGLARASDGTVTLFHTADDDADASQGEFLLRGAADRLEELGVDERHIDRRLIRGDDASRDIAAAATEYDILVLGESEPSLRDRIIGDTLSRIVRAVDRPTLIVRDVS